MRRQRGHACRDIEHRQSWRVVMRNGSMSCNTGYEWSPSDWSLITCQEDGKTWRTNAIYVDSLPDQEED